MNKSGKIIVTILLIIIFFIATIFFNAAGISKTFSALFALGLFFGIKAMWKKPKQEQSDEIKLNKNENTIKNNQISKK